MERTSMSVVANRIPFLSCLSHFSRIFILLTFWLPHLSLQAAIFGADDREVITPQSQAYSLSKSTAIAVLNSLIEPSTSGPGFDLFADSLTERLCKEEKFSYGPSLQYGCTGFLVAPDLLATAGHCMVNTGESKNEEKMYCEVFVWLFDYNETKDKTTQITNIPPEKLYRCKKIIYAVKDEVAPFRDYALIQLDRPVLDREPLKLSSAPVLSSDRLSMIGYPLGSSAKLAKGARVMKNDLSKTTFETNLDALQGNSGSPVFNQRNEVVGILVEGSPSENLIHRRFDPRHKNSSGHDGSKSCEVYNRCDSFGRNCTLAEGLIGPASSGVHRLAPLIELIDAI